MQDRRRFLATLGSLAAGIACARGGGSARSADTAGAAPPMGSPRQRLDRIGVQLYTVRRELERDFEGTLSRVAELGFREVEFAGYFGRTPEQVRQALAARGLIAPAAHLSVEAVRTDWPRTLDVANAIGHRYLVVAWLPAEERRTLDDYRRFARLFNDAGAAARRAGLTFGYHNHDFEFAPIDGRIPYDVLLGETDGAIVVQEMDLYWITKGGQDPLDYFARFPGRFHMVHVKDSAGPPEHRMVDVGSGRIDFARIFARRAQAGIRHFFVEHDDPTDPLATLRASHDYLKGLEF